MKIKNPRFIIQEIVIVIGFVLFYYSLSMIGIMLMILGGLIGLLFIFPIIGILTRLVLQ